VIRYTLRLQPDPRYGLQFGAEQLTAEVLEQLIEGAIVHDIQSSGPGYPAEVDFQLDQDPNDALLNTVLVAIQRCAYSVVEGEIISWVDAESQGTFYGLLGGAGAGATTKNTGAMLLGAAAGAIVGHLAGRNVQKREVIFQIARPYPGAQVQLLRINNAAVPKITLTDWLAVVNPGAQPG
jgi:hypothetical protein